MDEQEIINQALLKAYMLRYEKYRASHSFVLALCYLTVVAAIVGIALLL